jgi:hypothetical protein
MWEASSSLRTGMKIFMLAAGWIQ